MKIFISSNGDVSASSWTQFRFTKLFLWQKVSECLDHNTCGWTPQKFAGDHCCIIDSDSDSNAFIKICTHSTDEDSYQFTTNSLLFRTISIESWCFKLITWLCFLWEYFWRRKCHFWYNVKQNIFLHTIKDYALQRFMEFSTLWHMHQEPESW